MLNRRQLQTLQEIIAKRISYKSKSKWLINLSQDTGIGTVKGGFAVFGIKDIDNLERYLIANDFPVTSNEGDFSNRIEASKHVGNEKITGNAVTCDRILGLFPKRSFIIKGQALPQGRAMDFTLDEVLSIDLSQALVIENLSAFLNVMQYPNLLSMLECDSIVLFRGMAGCYALQGAMRFLERFSGKKIGWFDFDPSGIAALGHTKFESLLVPDIEEMKSLLSSGKLKSDPQKYFSQTKTDVPPNLDEHIRFMKTNKLAVSQEYMTARNIKLVEVKMK